MRMSEELLERWRSEVLCVCLFCSESIFFFFGWGEGKAAEVGVTMAGLEGEWVWSA